MCCSLIIYGCEYKCIKIKQNENGFDWRNGINGRSSWRTTKTVDHHELNGLSKF